MKFLDAEFVQGFIRMANDGWEQGWHERNGGNLSYRVKPEEVEAVRENFQEKEWQPIGTTVPNLAGEYFLVTGSGKYFRNVILKPEDSICMIELDEKGEQVSFMTVLGGFNGLKKTIPRAEGVTMDENGTLYMVSEPNLFYRFEKTKK